MVSPACRTRYDSPVTAAREPLPSRTHPAPGIGPDPVIYEIYPRSFADSNGDGIGDLAGITSRLDHLAGLGIDAIWLTPIFASPQFDFGYDVSDYCDIHHEYGTIADAGHLIDAAHRRGIGVIFDMVLGHTSIQHPWFRQHPERYHWADGVPNNWLSVFGGSAWTLDPVTGRHYYHRYYPEQPNLNWAHPDVRAAMHVALTFWTDRGVDGFRLDAFDGLTIDPELGDEPAATSAGMAGREHDTWSAYWSLDHIRTSNLPAVIDELAALRAAFPATKFIVEADLTNHALQPYLAHADCAFAFEFFRAPVDPEVLGSIIDGTGRDGALAWALSNHDFSRVATRWGRDRARLAAMLLLTLPGWSFIYQGDEIGMVDGAADAGHDRSGRDRVRHPMQWDPSGGFTTGRPWLPLIDSAECNVADQVGGEGSTLELYRALIRVRRSLSGPVEVLDATPASLVFRRGDHVMRFNFGDEPLRLGDRGRQIFSTDPDGDADGSMLAPGAGVIETAPGP